MDLAIGKSEVSPPAGQPEPQHEAPAPGGDAQALPAALPQTVLRFDIHQRLQHGLMALSFTTLVLTGWPLAAHSAKPSSSLVNLFGGIESCSLWHRIAGVVLAVAAVYHLVYLTVLAVRRKLRPSMVPAPRDLTDLVHNLSFFLGRRKERPKFGRFTYFEKFDYWAVFWGVFIMVGSGVVRWFPVETTKVMPAWVYDIAHYAHADEALLAALAIFVWHFYNVHLRPGIFPMSKVFLTGRLTLEQLEEEHGAEYEELLRSHGKGRPAPEDAR